MLAIAYFFFSILTLIIATFTDLKERIVSNKLTYSIIVLAIVLKAFESFTQNSFTPITTALIAGIIAFTFSYILWRLGAWAGGDVKLLTAIALMNPVNYAVLAKTIGLNSGIFATTNLPVFAISLAIYSALMVFPLGILMVFKAALEHKKILEKTKEKLKEKAIEVFFFAALASGAKIAFSFYSIEQALILPLIIVAAFLPKKYFRMLAATFTIAGAIISTQEFFVAAIAITAPLLIGYGLWEIYSQSRKTAFREKIKSAEIQEGVIPDKFIVERNGKIFFEEMPGIKKVIKQLIANTMEKNKPEAFKIEGKILASPMQAGGLTEEEAEKLREKAGKGLMPETITVKKTMAFVPAILLAYIALQLTGDVLWNLLL